MLINALHTLTLLVRDIIALLAIVVFLAGGVWTLHMRFQRKHELPLRVQSAILAAVMVFYFILTPILRLMLLDNVVYFIFSLLGLLVAGLALYGHVLVSVVSRLLVELLIPDNPATADIPRLGPAEALERQGDLEGALSEYYVLARIYPDNPMLSLRAAKILMRLNRDAEAVTWLERAIKHTHKPEDNLAIVRRLCDTLESLDEPERANEMLRRFVARFAEHETGRSVSKALEQRNNNEHNDGPPPPESPRLTALDKAPIQQKKQE